MSSRVNRPQPTAGIRLSQRDLDSLVRISDLYMSIKAFRLLVRATAPREIRARLHFVSDESRWLKLLAREIRADMRERRDEDREVQLTVPALVGYWGRLLASVNTPRYRKRLSQSEYDVRQSLILRFQESLSSLLGRHARTIEDQLATRRPVEEIWMRERLRLPQRLGQVDESPSDP